MFFYLDWLLDHRGDFELLEKKLGQNGAPWMADRLDAWLLLLSDVEILETDNTGSEYSVGKNASWV